MLKKLSENDLFKHMTPQYIVEQLNRYVVGQSSAKKKVSIALRHRFIRKFVQGPLRDEITPKNILMMGPTGVGKTEIVRRLASILDVPFIKVEATKFTEVGYVGRDVESIIRDLADKAVKEQREKSLDQVSILADEKAKQIILDKLIDSADDHDEIKREEFLQKLLNGDFNDDEIEIEIAHSIIDVEIMAPPGMEEMTSQIHSVFQSLGGDRKKKKTMKVVDALKFLKEEEASKLLDDDQIKNIALQQIEEQGIIFIDEIDKVCQRKSDFSTQDVSREGVQRDLLPLIEGCTVATKYGPVKTDHILFITSGAFHLSKPSDLIPELQGRLPVRVELSPLTVNDFILILSATDASLIAQYKALLAVENVNLNFSEDGIERIAQIACEVNERSENIGARRLHTVMERLLEDVFFDVSFNERNVLVDKNFVDAQLSSLLISEDLHQFIL